MNITPKQHMTPEITIAHRVIGTALFPAFLALRAKGVLDLDFDQKKVRLKVLASEAFILMAQASTGLLERLIVCLALVDLMKRNGLWALVYEIDGVFYQGVQRDGGRIPNVPWLAPEFEGVEPDTDPGLERRVLCRLLNLEKEGVL
jgi:hypothetical protein